MIPVHWQKVRRPDDDEVVGYLVPDGADVVPTTLVGTPLPRGLLDAAVPAPGWEWRPVVVVEVAPDGVRVRPEWPAPEEMAAQAALPVPVGGLLAAQPPG